MAQCRISPRSADSPVAVAGRNSSNPTPGETSNQNIDVIEVRPSRKLNRKKTLSSELHAQGKRRSWKSPIKQLNQFVSKSKPNDAKGAFAISEPTMKTKQKEEKTEDDQIPESSAKTRARKKNGLDDDKIKDTDSDKATALKECSAKKKILKKPPIIKKRPLGITKTLRSAKVIAKDKTKKNIKQIPNKKGRRPIRKVNLPETKDAQEKPVNIIPESEIKKEPIDDTPTVNSRSSSPKVSGVRRQRLTSDIEMMKSVLGDSPTSLLLGSRTSPYAMRSERSNSPYKPESKNLRSAAQRKLKNNLLNEIVKNEQKKRRLVSDSKVGDFSLDGEEPKKIKRGRSFSRDGSEISKCSDVTESDLSLCETLSSDADGKPEEIKKLTKDVKTELDLDIEETSLPVQTDLEKVPSSTVECKSEHVETTSNVSLINECADKITSLKRSSSLDSDNNNRMKSTNLQNNILETETKTDNDAVDRSAILNNMSKTFNTDEMTKNIRKAKRGRRQIVRKPKEKKLEQLLPQQSSEDSLSKEINELIETLEMCEAEDNHGNPVTNAETVDSTISSSDANMKIQWHPTSVDSIKSPSKLDPLQSVAIEEFKTPLVDQNKEKLSERSVGQVTEISAKNLDDSENIRLRIAEDEYSEDKIEDSTKENAKFQQFRPSTQDIDKLMDKLKHFEELDKKRQQELKAKTNESVMVTNDVVLIPKSGADIKPLKDIQATMSPDKPIEKGNVLSCFQNNSAISILKRDHVRKSVDIDLPNSITLIKRNPIARKESTGSNSGDTISLIEKSLGKDVTLTELRRSVDKPISPSVDQFATIQPNKPGTIPQSIATIVSNSSLSTKNDSIKKELTHTNGNKKSLIRKSRDSISGASLEPIGSKERIKSPPLATVKSLVLSPKGNTMKSPVRCIQSPTPEITLAEPILAEPSLPEIKEPLPVMQVITAPVVMQCKLSTDIQKEVKINTEKLTASVVTPPLLEVNSTSKDEKKQPILVNIRTVTEDSVNVPVLTENMKSPSLKFPPILVKGPPCEVKETVTSPCSDDKKPNVNAKSPQKVNTSSKDTPKPPSPAKTSPVIESKIDALVETVTLLPETPESQKRKESIFRMLGLLTIKAADEAKIERQKQKVKIEKQRELANKNNKGKVSSGGESSGTLKTVIKINRGLNQDKKNKNRSSLKMTFQKSKSRAGKPALESGDGGSETEDYYTIHKDGGTASGTGDNTIGGHRKTHYSNRYNNNDMHGPEQPTKSPEPPPGKEASLNLVIPEKASSFSIHPGRLCQDQCFYCGGKFGLFDTPCHIAQMKSTDRQRKVLDNEEKLTIDSCLCDACYRHVDRRANCPSYRKRPNFISKPLTPPETSASNTDTTKTTDNGEVHNNKLVSGRPSICHAAECSEAAEHSIRRKWLIKMRNSVNKVVKLNIDYPGLHTIPLCGAHYRPVAQLMVCGLCRRRLNKHHNIHYISQGYQDLNPLIEAQGIPVRFNERPVVCKLCRYFCTILTRPSQQQNKKHFLKTHRRRLMQTYNIQLPDDEPELEGTDETKESNEEDASNPKQKKKNKTGKSKQRKSTDSCKQNDDSNECGQKVTDTNTIVSPEKIISQPMEEDIESLISSNKISKAPGETNITSDNSDADTIVEFEATVIPSFDKQTELQYLLQKQNNPALFLQKPNANLTQKQRNILKAHNVSAIQKPGAQVKVYEKNAKRIQKLGQIITQKEPGKSKKDEEVSSDESKSNDATSVNILKNISLTDECTIESIPVKKPADISILKNKWQMSESFSQVKKNLSELSKNVTNDKPKKSSDSKYSNPVRRLETNPSISVRELFPGEEEMNLHCSIDFNNIKGVTPEGWEKCNSTIQYDVETKKLWHELQKPYGNQSSFLRHLVLLEKYFRSGDLILAHNANGNATNYSDSVQCRLRAYDNVPETTKRTQPAISLIEYRRPKTNSGKSLLKSNQSVEIIPKPTDMRPPAPKQPEPSVSGVSKQPKGGFASFPPMTAPSVFAKPRPAGRPSLPSSTAITSVEMKPVPKQKQPTLPPELISIHTPTSQGRKSIENVLKNIQQLVKGVTAPPEPMDVAPPVVIGPPPPPPPPTPSAPKPEHMKKQKQRTTTKPWRPTLMQITEENLERIAREPNQVAIDGRSLPSLVQVMSGGQRYHITLADYNKMCIMRREKLQQIQVVENSAKGKKPMTELVTEIQSTSLGNGGTLTQNVTVPTESRIEGTDSPNTSYQSKSDVSEASRVESNAANILKNVGLKNITIAPVKERTKPTSTITSNSLLSPSVTSSSLVISSTPIKMPQLGPSMTITSDTLISPGISSGLTISASPILSPYGATIQPLVMPKIPKSLTVIPQTVPITSSMLPTSIMNIPTSVMNVQSSVINVPSSVMNMHSSVMNVSSVMSGQTSIVTIPSSMVNVPASTIVSMPVNAPSMPMLSTTSTQP